MKLSDYEWEEIEREWLREFDEALEEELEEEVKLGDLDMGKKELWQTIVELQNQTCGVVGPQDGDGKKEES